MFKNDNVIFLDFDGVLNTENYICCRIYAGEKLSDGFGHLFDPLAMCFLESLLKKTDAKIVVSSSWRLSGIKWMRELWKTRGYYGEIADVTFSKTTTWYAKQKKILEKKSERITRGDEIYAYLKTHPGIKNYVILDDDTDMLPEQEDHWVITNQMYGFDCRSYERALEILTGKNM